MGFRNSKMSLLEKFWQVNWGLILIVTLISSVGFAMLYSAANGSVDPWASRQMVRFGIGIVLLLVIAVIDIRIWFRYAYVLYFVAFILLVAVEFFGVSGMGAQRWIDLKVIQLQPSEVMKVALVLALARCFHGMTTEDIARPTSLILPIAIVFAPAALVLKQPDLGTAIMLSMGGAAVFFCAGVRLWKFILVGVAGLGAIPVIWQFLREYQKQRVMTFLNPEIGPLGAGYHMLQSKIALGSGGLFGKGFIQGSQSHLNFLPEKQTDFTAGVGLSLVVNTATAVGRILARVLVHARAVRTAAAASRNSGFVAAQIGRRGFLDEFEFSFSTPRSRFAVRAVTSHAAVPRPRR